MMLVCAPADARLALPGSVFKHRCSKCSARVMTAPDGQQRLRSDPTVAVVCFSCYQADVRRDDVLPPTREQIDALKTAMPNLWRERN